MESVRPSRRDFLKLAGAAGGVLLLELEFGTGRAAVASTAAAGFVPNAFLRIDRQGVVTFAMPYIEMGQGTYTAVSMLLAEELEVSVDRVHLEHAPPDSAYANPLIGEQMT